jgi:TetR/AcrR family transcriptional regulator, regulator of autoinduction and epiphytic fitness
MKGGPRRRGEPDPRIERSRERILRAALDELGEVGYGAFAMESVAGRSGVAKSTLYRHWRDKVALIGAAFETFHEQKAPDLGSGSSRERLERIVAHVSQVFGDSVFSACIPALIDGAERDRGLRSFHHRFQRNARTPLVAVIADGVTRGDFRSGVDPELAASAILGAVLYGRLMSQTPLQPNRASALIDAVLGNSRRRSGDSRRSVRVGSSVTRARARR